MTAPENSNPHATLAARRWLDDAIEQGLPLEVIERRYLAYLVAQTGTKTSAARAAGVDRRTVQRKLIRGREA